MNYVLHHIAILCNIVTVIPTMDKAHKALHNEYPYYGSSSLGFCPASFEFQMRHCRTISSLVGCRLHLLDFNDVHITPVNCHDHIDFQLLHPTSILELTMLRTSGNLTNSFHIYECHC